MKHTTLLATLPATVLLMTGCVASPESYLAAHPETPSNIASSMRRGDVVAGMTREQVRLIWGMPDSKADWSGGDSWAYARSANGGNSNKLREWGGVPVGSASSQQDQPAFSAPTMAGGKPRRMVYFRGDQVVLVEKAAGEL